MAQMSRKNKNLPFLKRPLQTSSGLFFLEKRLSSLLQEKNIESCSFLLAISGGIDSMVLAALFYELITHYPLKIAIAHCNFGLRKEASAKDAFFVENWAKERGIPFFLHTAASKIAHENTQNWARNVRYAFFASLQNTWPYHYLVTAHHLDDQIETFLLHALRGCSVKGLAAMQVVKSEQATELPSIAGHFRPLLSVSKAEIVQYSEQKNIPFREDATNQTLVYKRNFLRHELLAPLFEQYPNSYTTFAKTFDFLAQDNAFVEHQIEKIWPTIAQKTTQNASQQTWSIEVAVLNLETEYVLRKKLTQLFGANLSVLNTFFATLKNDKITSDWRLYTQKKVIISNTTEKITYEWRLERKKIAHKEKKIFLIILQVQ